MSMYRVAASLNCVQTIGGEETVKTVILGEANLFLPRIFKEQQEWDDVTIRILCMTSSMHSESYSSVLALISIKRDRDRPVQNEN